MQVLEDRQCACSSGRVHDSMSGSLCRTRRHVRRGIGTTGYAFAAVPLQGMAERAGCATARWQGEAGQRQRGRKKASAQPIVTGLFGLTSGDEYSSAVGFGGRGRGWKKKEEKAIAGSGPVPSRLTGLAPIRSETFHRAPFSLSPGKTPCWPPRDAGIRLPEQVGGPSELWNRRFLVTGKCGSGPAAHGDRIGIACSPSVRAPVLIRPNIANAPLPDIVARIEQRCQAPTGRLQMPGCHTARPRFNSRPTFVHHCGVRAPDLIRERLAVACGVVIRLGSQRSRDAASVASFKPSQALPVNPPTQNMKIAGCTAEV
ncbi:hypothetical protein F5144DRAFT_255794 [Chaetomium tenue]|uniref:Uncharacterized protein n=1 Tax=Chaetomium tenue TaxID=1854479 RepID=A0ACB7P949_9PEZI|nr:hypothetical protein F5144DRAFT_255794 [Chaetomium globosum]